MVAFSVCDKERAESDVVLDWETECLEKGFVSVAGSFELEG